VPAIYVIAVLLVLLFLYGAYRTMGAGASAGEDPAVVLAAVLRTTGEAATALEAASQDGGKPEEAHTVRRTLEGCAQALERIAATPVDAALDQARTALERAVDELSWSARLTETPGYSRDEALRDAALTLRGRGTEQLTRALTLIGG
jgi:hypothetical protein